MARFEKIVYNGHHFLYLSCVQFWWEVTFKSAYQNLPVHPLAPIPSLNKQTFDIFRFVNEYTQLIFTFKVQFVYIIEAICS